MTGKVTAEDIRTALEKFYSSPEWYLGFEVGNSTGTDCRRHADAVALNAYPSKGFEIRGFEIKVSKSDLDHELAIGIKSDEVARYCDYWFLVVPKGLADGATLPPTWGVIEFNDGGLRQKVRAEKLDKISPSAGFMAAMLRGRERGLLNAASKVSEDAKKAIEQHAIWSVKNSESELRSLREKLAEIKKATGISLDGWEPTQYVIDKLKAVHSLELITRNIRAIERAAKSLIDDVTEIQAAALEMSAGQVRV